MNTLGGGSSLLSASASTEYFVIFSLFFLVLLRRESGCMQQDWRENFHDLPPMKPGVSVSRSGVETDRKNHKLRKICRTESGRTSYFQIGDDHSAEYALKFYCELPDNGRAVSLSKIPGKLYLSALDVQKLLTLLDSFELVTIE